VLLYICYEFSHVLHRNPKDWRDIFDFLRYNETKSVLKEMAIEAAKASSGAGNG